MTTIFFVNPTVREILMMVLYILLLVQMGCFLVSFSETGKYVARSMIPLFLISFLALCSVRYVNRISGWNPDVQPDTGWKWLHSLPAGGVILFVLVLVVLTWHFFRKSVKVYQNSITRSSIKESIDNLPAGLGFCAPNGRILLANRRMEELCHAITGEDFQDANQFWRILTDGTGCEGTERISEGNAPCFRLSDKTIWTFGQKLLCVDGKNVIQITAVNTTRLHQLSEELRENNRKSEEMSIRLKQYGENMKDFVRSREILEAKMRIHNEMGQALLASRSYLLQGSSPMRENDLLKQWECVIALLKKEAEPQNPKKIWSSFVDSAGLAGVKIFLEGNIPKQEETVKLIVAAAAEALTNAVRHEGADELYMKLSEAGNGLQITFTDNGKNPDGEIIEGGGLTSLRIRLEESGGTMEIKTEPEFTLAVTVPAGREEKC